MKKTGTFLLVVSVVFLFSCNNNSSGNKNISGRDISKAEVRHPLAVMKTKFGTIVVELYPDKAPLTVANFERYIRENRLKDATFYRTVTMKNQPGKKVKIQVIQGGLFRDDHPDMLPPIILETTKQTGLHHLNGTLSMARDKPNSATSEFFICIGNQPSLDYGGKRNPDGKGFAAFGQVIKGMEVVKKIHQQPSDHQMLTPKVKIDTIYLKEEK
ncbi:Peptidyl-prolyl cis-trans isomerase [hydrothermal vent metagenome]|uniref:peptidylprolyl isomerase n=1 Tax=hydrothermal vent metagenome TaxID=652676 RepID=A0A3B0UWS6_9ZZZZ